MVTLLSPVPLVISVLLPCVYPFFLRLTPVNPVHHPIADHYHDGHHHHTYRDVLDYNTLVRHHGHYYHRPVHHHHHLPPLHKYHVHPYTHYHAPIYHKPHYHEVKTPVTTYQEPSYSKVQYDDMKPSETASYHSPSSYHEESEDQYNSDTSYISYHDLHHRADTGLDDEDRDGGEEEPLGDEIGGMEYKLEMEVLCEQYEGIVRTLCSLCDNQGDVRSGLEMCRMDPCLLAGEEERDQCWQEWEQYNNLRGFRDHTRSGDLESLSNLKNLRDSTDLSLFRHETKNIKDLRSFKDINNFKDLNIITELSILRDPSEKVKSDKIKDYSKSKDDKNLEVSRQPRDLRYPEILTLVNDSGSKNFRNLIEKIILRDPCLLVTEEERHLCKQYQEEKSGRTV